jgi:hypothetical protein
MIRTYSDPLGWRIGTTEELNLDCKVWPPRQRALGAGRKVGRCEIGAKTNSCVTIRGRPPSGPGTKELFDIPTPAAGGGDFLVPIG